MRPLARRYFYDGNGASVLSPAEGFSRAYEISPGGLVAGEVADKDRRVIPFVLQAEHVMRNGDIVRVGPSEKGQGQIVENYITNPVVFAQHCSFLPAIGYCENLVQDVKASPFPQTTADVVFHAEPMNEMAQLYWTLYRDKVQRAGSTGIWVLAFDALREEGQEGIPDFFLPWDIGTSELSEFSLVGLPNDPIALAQNGAPAAAADLTGRVLESASLASKSDGIAHARAVARFLANAFGREAFADVLPPAPVSELREPVRIHSLDPVDEPQPVAVPVEPLVMSETDLDAIALGALATL